MQEWGFPQNQLIAFNIRPRKRAFLIQQGSMAHLMEAIEEATTCWGGMTFPIIPVRAKRQIAPFYEHLLRIHEPDILIDLVGIKEELATRLGTMLPSSTLSDWSAFRQDDHTMHALSLAPPPLSQPVVDVLKIYEHSDREVERCCRVAFGIIPDKQKVDYNQVYSLQVISIHTATDFLTAQLLLNTPLGNTTLQMYSYSITGFVSMVPIIYLVVNAVFDELVRFWNMRNSLPNIMKNPVILLPVQLIESDLQDQDKRDRLRIALEQFIATRPQLSKPDLLLYSTSLSHQEVANLISPLGIHRYQGKKLGSSYSSVQLRDLQKEPLTFLYNIDLRHLLPETFREGLIPHKQELCIIEEPKSLLRFEPSPDFKPQWRQDICLDIEDLPLMQFPRSDVIARTAHSNARYTKYGLTFLTSATQQEYTFNLTIPGIWQLFETYFSSFDKTINLSDKGKYAHGVLNLIGDDLTKLDFLANQNTYELLKRLTPPSRKKLSQRLKSQLGIQRSLEKITEALVGIDLILDRIDVTVERMMSSIKISKDVLLSILDQMAEHNFLFRGISVRCPSCGYLKWYTLRELDEKILCIGCRSSFSLSIADNSGGNEHAWSYSLNELLVRAMDQDVLPHLLCIRALCRNIPYPLYVPGLLLNSGMADTREIDVVTVSNGQLTIAECKTSGRNLSIKDFDRQAVLARELHASKLVFACMDIWNDRIREKAIDLTSHGDLEILLLDEKEMLGVE